MLEREILRDARHKRIRKKVSGSAKCPRLNVYRSLNNIYANIVDDETGKTLLSASTLNKEARETAKSGGNVEAAKVVGESIAKLALKKRIKRVVFDRGGYKYHGRVKALAEAARKSGLEF